MNDCEISIERYNITKRDRIRKGRGMVCYVSNKICYNAKKFFIPNEKENILLSFLSRKQNQLLLE